jgi:hypothetical protein
MPGYAPANAVVHGIGLLFEKNRCSIRLRGRGPTGEHANARSSRDLTPVSPPLLERRAASTANRADPACKLQMKTGDGRGDDNLESSAPAMPSPDDEGEQH